MKKFEVFGLQSLPEIRPGDNLPKMIIDSAEEEIGALEAGDILILTSKIISKSMGLVKKKSDVKVTKDALAVSGRTGKDPVWVQMVMDEGHEIITVIPLNGIFREHVMDASEDIRCSTGLCDYEQCILVTLSPRGILHTCDAGIDGSNHPEGVVSFMPPDPDEVAEAVRQEISSATGKDVAVILADTELMPFGTMDFAVGSSGIEPRSREFGKADKFGRPKFGGMDLTAHQLVAAAALHFGQIDAGIPAVVVRGYRYCRSDTRNIANTLWPVGSRQQARRAVREIMRATAGARPLAQRLLLKIASWFV